MALEHPLSIFSFHKENVPFLKIASKFKMKKAVLIFTACILFSTLKSQNMTPEQVVQQSLEAYNNRDIEKFMALFSNDIEMYNFNTGKLTAKGLPEVRKIYQDMFNVSPKLHSDILKRIVFDDKIIDHEYITGRMGSDAPLEIVLIYEVKAGKIVKTTAIRK